MASITLKINSHVIGIEMIYTARGTQHLFDIQQEKDNICVINKDDIHNMKKTILCLIRTQMIYTIIIERQHLFDRNKKHI